MRTILRQFAIALALASVAGGAIAAPHDDDRRGHDRHYPSDWRDHDDDRRDAREHRRHEREWQHRQRAELRRRAEWQRQRDRAWQRRQEAELRRQLNWQRRYDSAYANGYRDGYRDDNRWQRGHRYHGRHYVVRDYGHYHLRRPPYGHHWVQADGKYLLVAIATGLILDIASR